jgi:hypothetical protein
LPEHVTKLEVRFGLAERIVEFRESVDGLVHSVVNSCAV